MLLPFHDIWHQTLLNIFQYIHICIVNKCRKSISLCRQVKCSAKPSHRTLFFAENDVYVIYHFTGTSHIIFKSFRSHFQFKILEDKIRTIDFAVFDNSNVYWLIDWLTVCVRVYIVQTYRIIFVSEAFSVERRIEFNIYSDFIALNVNIRRAAKGWWNHQ